MSYWSDRLWSHTDLSTTDCLLWNGAVNKKGYGVIEVSDRNWLAHVLAYFLVKGPVPSGKVLDHLCRVHNCINPDHLEPVTDRENILRGVGIAAVNANKTECIRGHALSGSNLYVNPTNGKRKCKTCKNLRKRERLAARHNQGDGFYG